MDSVLELLRPGMCGTAEATPTRRRTLTRQPVIMMLPIILGAVLLSWVISSGLFDRAPNGHVLPGTYHVIPKHYSLRARSGFTPSQEVHMAPRLPGRQTAILLAIALGVVAIVYGAGNLRWGNLQLGAFYTFLGLLIAVLGGCRACGGGIHRQYEGDDAGGVAGGSRRAVKVVLRNTLVLALIAAAVAVVIAYWCPEPEARRART